MNQSLNMPCSEGNPARACGAEGICLFYVQTHVPARADIRVPVPARRRFDHVTKYRMEDSRKATTAARGWQQTEIGSHDVSFAGCQFSYAQNGIPTP